MCILASTKDFGPPKWYSSCIDKNIQYYYTIVLQTIRVQLHNNCIANDKSTNYKTHKQIDIEYYYTIVLQTIRVQTTKHTSR
jgi:hypothetical protein